MQRDLKLIEVGLRDTLYQVMMLVPQKQIKWHYFLFVLLTTALYERGYFILLI